MAWNIDKNKKSINIESKEAESQGEPSGAASRETCKNAEGLPRIGPEGTPDRTLSQRGGGRPFFRAKYVKILAQIRYAQSHRHQKKCTKKSL